MQFSAELCATFGRNQQIDRSATQEFFKRLGADDITGQLMKQSRDLGFAILSHDTLNAPISYHIPFNDPNLDYAKLASGIKLVLEDATRKCIPDLAFFALGHDLVRSEEEPFKRRELAANLSKTIAEAINDYVQANYRRTIPKLIFGFVSSDTREEFERAFANAVIRDPQYVKYLQHMSQTEKNLIQGVLTHDTKYISALSTICQYLDEDTPILILGETGVGKSYLAKLIHKNSARASRPFQQANCALLREERVETTIFGWKKGSFTDAREDGAGLVDSAMGGTLFLDEVARMSLGVQSAMLTFIEDKEYKRFGDAEKRIADVRLILGTNANIPQAISSGEFANDLYERISQVEITIPPLRERKEDIGLVADLFISELNRNNDYEIGLESAAREKLKTFRWPGNVRQLKVYIEFIRKKAELQHSEAISVDLIESNPPREISYADSGPLIKLESALLPLLRSWRPSDGKITKDLIEPILAKLYMTDLKGNKTKAGEILGIDGSGGSGSTLDKRLRSYADVIKKFPRLS